MKTNLRMFQTNALTILLVLSLFSTAGFAGGSLEAEQLYLADSGTRSDGITTLYRIDVDTATGRANLIPLPDVGFGPGVIPFDWVHAIAVTPDGKKLYVLDQFVRNNGPGTGMMGVYNLENPSWTEIALVKHNGNIVPGLVLAAFSHDGTLYVASGRTESVYTVNLSTGEATLIGVVVNSDTNGQLNLVGADIVFTFPGDFYLYTNGSSEGAPRGLYLLTLPAVGGKIFAKLTAAGDVDDHNYTGLALRAGGIGSFIASVAEDHFHVFSADGSEIPVLPMFRDGQPYDYRWGDMSSTLDFCTLTIGYWKNHSWDGRTVEICDVVVNEALGKKILTKARNTRFSMLIAQLIAAKLNTFNSSGIGIIDEAEAWLCSQDGVVVNGKIKWWMEFSSSSQKRKATRHKDNLDRFNNENHCEEDVSL